MQTLHFILSYVFIIHSIAHTPLKPLHTKLAIRLIIEQNYRFYLAGLISVTF